MSTFNRKMAKAAAHEFFRLRMDKDELLGPYFRELLGIPPGAALDPKTVRAAIQKSEVFGNAMARALAESEPAGRS